MPPGRQQTAYSVKQTHRATYQAVGLPCCQALPDLLSGTERILSVCGKDFSSSGVLGKDPFKCVVKIAKNVNSFFAGGFTIYLKHSGKSKYQVASH
jgi:hypothetical protein